MITTKKISVVVVCYYDELAIKALYKRLSDTLKKITPSFEIIYVNDSSPDNSEVVLREIAATDKNLTIINHSRNFGAQAGFTSGMVQATGDAVVLMDGDLQDPPELIEEFVKKWLDGNMVVYGIRKEREASMGKLKEKLYHLFYLIFSYSAYIKIPSDAGDFSIMDRVVVDHINNLPERDRFIRGLRAWVGYKNTGINYKRPERFDGRASVSTKGLISAFRWARKAIFSFSYKPLEIVTYIAICTTILALLGIIFYVGAFILYGGAPEGFLTTIVIVLFFASIQLLTLSIIGEYVGKIFEEVKGRPRYIIRDVVNDHRKKGHE